MAGNVSRGQSVVYALPHDWASISQFLAPVLQRVDDRAPCMQLLVVTSSDEITAAVATAAVRLVGDRPINILGATAARRAARVLGARPAHVVAGTPETLVDLLRAAALEVNGIRQVAIAWADELAERGAIDTLETLMSELPKDSARVVVTSEVTPAVEQLIERYARRARRVVAPTSDTDRPFDLRYVTVSAATRLTALRRLLDEIDPRSAMVFARPDSAEPQVRELLAALGYAGPDAAVTVGREGGPGTELVVLFDLPATREELRGAANAAQQTVALVQPSQLPSLRALAAGGSLAPITLPESGARARERDALVRAELRAQLEQGALGREILSLEPLLDEFDGVEIAAAAVQLLERERAARAAAAAARPQGAATPRAERQAAPMVRLFVNIGSRDSVRPGDLVGAIANGANIDSGDVGKIDVRESHSVVEVAASVADTVIERVTGTPIRGRRAVVRRDEGAPARREGAGGGRESGRAPRGDRRERPDRGGEHRRGEHRHPADKRRPPSDRPRPATRTPRSEDRE